MEKTVSTLDWRPVTTAPADADLELSIYDNSDTFVSVPLARSALPM